MHFEQRDLPPYAEPVSKADLREGSVYFSIIYVDQDLQIPVMEALVFIGKDLEPSDSGQVYFQDAESYLKGFRYADEKGAMQIHVGSEKEIGHIFEYEKALEELMRCSLRRQGKEQAISCETLQADERLSKDARDDMVPSSFRFDDAGLQAALIEELQRAALRFEIRGDGAVVFDRSNWVPINTVVHRIRDGCFRWYLSWWKDRPNAAHRFWQEMPALYLESMPAGAVIGHGSLPSRQVASFQAQQRRFSVSGRSTILLERGPA